MYNSTMEAAQMTNPYKSLVGKSEEKKLLRKPKLKWKNKYYYGSYGIGVCGYGLNLFISVHGPVTGWCEHSDETSLSITSGGFLNQLSYYKLLKQNTSGPWMWCFF
jgi:hypothetical protein